MALLPPCSAMHIRRGATAALPSPLRVPCLALLLLLLVLPAALAADSDWNFADVQSKQQAIARATTLSLLSQPEDQATDAKTIQKAGLRAGVTVLPGQALNVSRAKAAPTRSDSPEVLRLRGMFRDWAASYNYTFTAQDEAEAFDNFCRSMAEVQAINTDASIPFWASGNAFSHLSFEEFQSQHLSDFTGGGLTRLTEAWVPDEEEAPASRRLLGDKSLAPPPRSVNWVKAGKVTTIRNQGSCRSCWAFAATSVIESMYLIKVGGDANSLHLSEQQLLDCVSADNGPYNSNGCRSGYVNEAIDYVANINQTTNTRYPYSGEASACKASILVKIKAGRAVRLKGRTKMVSPASSEAALIKAVASAPTIVYYSVDSSFMHYSGGVYQPTTCTTALNHAVVAVGYNTKSDNNYWIVRNSWGGSWGEQGYARVQMTGDGLGPCGMYQYAFLPPSKFLSKPLAA